jgi:hypothetical protein
MPRFSMTRKRCSVSATRFRCLPRSARALQRTIRFHRIPPHRLSYRRKHDLFEADGFGIVEPEQTKSSEVRCQQRNAHRKPLLRHYKQEDSAVHKPTVSVLEKEQLQALVVERTYF